MFTFLSYTYAHHVLDGVRHQCEPTFDELKQSKHTANDYEMNVRHLYQSILQLVDDLNDQSNSKHQQIIQWVKNQLEICKTINGYIAPDGKTATCTSHLPQFTLDLVTGRSPRIKNHSNSCGELECEACRCPFLIHDQLRWAALEKIVYFLMYSSQLHQCERRTFRYMSHVVHDLQQQYQMKHTRSIMAADTTYIIFDFKQKFWARGFREGGDAYYVMLWFGMGAYVKPADLSLDKDTAHDELPKNKELEEELQEELQEELEE